MKKIIKGIKYRLVKDAMKELCLLSREPILNHLCPLLSVLNNSGCIGNTYIQPVPLSKHRLNQRGFNQAVGLGRFVSCLSGFPLIDIVEKTRDTPPQAKAELKDRKKNIKGAFSLKTPPKKHTTFLLVDDVVTSGSTTGEIARVCKEGGVKKVYVFSVAKG